MIGRQLCYMAVFGRAHVLLPWGAADLTLLWCLTASYTPARTRHPDYAGGKCRCFGRTAAPKKALNKDNVFRF